MTQSIDDILAGRDATQEPAKETIQQPTERGITENVADQRHETESPETEQTGNERESGSQKMVPHEALHAEKQKVKRYTEEVADFRKSNETLQRQVAELLQRLPVQQQQTNQEEPVDWFQDPDIAFRQRGAQMLNPVVSELNQVRSQLMQMQAEKVFGDKFADFMGHVREGANRGDPEIAALDTLMSNSPNPYAVAKEWFDRKTFDPNAERERIKAELLSEIQSQSETQPRQPAPVMPSNLAGARNVGNRSGPAWSGPPTIADIFKR